MPKDFRMPARQGPVQKLPAQVHELFLLGCKQFAVCEAGDANSPQRPERALLRFRPALLALLSLSLLAAGSLTLASCSGDETTSTALNDVDENDRLKVDVATNRQMQIGYQIASVAASENALDLCFEMCNRSSESCFLAADVCNVAKRYPNVVALKARCDVTRERCRVHRTKVPRQCPCDP